MDLGEMMRSGVAVVVATTATDGHPAITRGWGPSYDEGSAVFRLAVAAPEGSDTLANLRSTGVIAVTVSEPLTYRTAQFKGSVGAIDVPSEADRAAALEHLGRFVADVVQLGIEDGVDRMFVGDLCMVSFATDELYDQTPGPDAGKRLR